MNATHCNNVSAAHVMAGFASFIFPGLGQLLLDRIKPAAFCFIAAFPAWFAGSFLIHIGFESPSIIIGVIGLMVFLMPHVLSAYFAANGHKHKSVPVVVAHKNSNEDSEEPDFGFSDYASYQAWCRENSNEPMSPKQFSDTFGK